MGALILPRRFMRQPQTATMIERGNPITQDLHTAYLGSTGQYFGGLSGVGFVLNPTQGYHHRFGNSTKRNDTFTTNLSMRQTNDPIPVGSNMTLVAVTRPPAAVTEAQMFNLGQTSGAVSASIVSGDGTNQVLRGRIYLGGTRYFGGSFTLSNSEPCVTAIRQRVSVEQAVFLNGVKDPVTSAFTGSSIGYQWWGVNGGGGSPEYFLLASWKRALTDAEIEDLAENPYQIFKNPVRRIWVLGAAAPTNFTLTAETGSFAAAGAAANLRHVEPSWTATEAVLYGTGQDKTPSTTFELFQGGSAMTAGDVAVVTLACDNLQTTDGISSTVSSVVGSHIGAFTKAYEYTNGEGSAGAGVTCSVWYARVSAAIAAGDDTITVTFASTVTAKAAIVRVFHSTQEEITVAAAQGSVSDSDPDVMTISDLPYGEYLFIRAAATERGSYGSINTDNYITYGAETTASPGDATDVQIFAESRVLTSTGDTTDPTTGAPQSASVYIALKAGPGVLDYPLTAGTGTIALTGNAAGTIAALRLTAAPASFALTGNAVTFARAYELIAAAGDFALSGKTAALGLSGGLVAESAAFSLTGNSAGLSAVLRIIAASGSFALSGKAAALTSAQSLIAEAGGFAFTGNDATTSATNDYELLAVAGAFLMRGRNTLLLGPGTGTVAGPTTVRQEDGYRYEPGPPPENATVDEALQWALQELQKAGNVINNLAGGKVEVTHVAPAKPRAGMIRMADGTDWNPGFGRGYYGFDDDSGTWKPLFQTSP